MPRTSLWLEHAGSSLAFSPEPMLEGPRKSSLPTRANARRPKKDYKKTSSMASHCFCQGFVLVCAEFFPSFHLGFLSESFVQMSSIFPFAQTCHLGMFHSVNEMCSPAKTVVVVFQLCELCAPISTSGAWNILKLPNVSLHNLSCALISNYLLE